MERLPAEREGDLRGAIVFDSRVDVCPFGADRLDFQRMHRLP